MEFLILGPLEVRDAGRSLAIGGARQRALLAILLTRANQVIGRDALIDELWGESPPETATNVLQGYISHLRKAVGNDVLQTRPPGYVAVLDPGTLDLHRFEELLATGSEALGHGDAAAAAASLRAALELWRGPALADFAYEPFAQAEIARLEELRLTALERRIEADLALGRDAELVGELEALVGRYPLRERPRAQLMLALYRAGRQAEALEAYQQARRALVDELGIDPSPALQDLEKAILRQDSSLDLARAPSSGEPAPVEPSSARGPILVVPGEHGCDRGAARPRRATRLAATTRVDPGRPRGGRRSASHHEPRLGRRPRRSGGAGRPARAAAFTTDDRNDDLGLLAVEQEAELLLVDAPVGLLDDGRLPEAFAAALAAMPCDVGILVTREASAGPGAVPSSSRSVASSTSGPLSSSEPGSRATRGVPLQLAGAAAAPKAGKRDASRLLARAALMVQRVAGVPTEPVLVPAGEAGVIEAAGSAGLVVIGVPPGWRHEGIGATRLAIARDAVAPTLLVRRGLRPGGLTPKKSLTRFTWSMATAEAVTFTPLSDYDRGRGRQRPDAGRVRGEAVQARPGDRRVGRDADAGGWLRSRESSPVSPELGRSCHGAVEEVADPERAVRDHERPRVSVPQGSRGRSRSAGSTRKTERGLACDVTQTAPAPTARPRQA